MARRLVCAALIALAAVTPAAAETIVGKKQRIDEKISSLNEKIAAARQRERELAAEIANVSARIRTLESEVGDVSRDLASLEQDLVLQQEKLDKITELWRLQTQKLKFLRTQHAQAVDRLSERIVEIYQSGNLTTVDVIVSAASFSDLISRLEYAKELAAQDERIAESVGLAKDRMRVAQARTTVTRKKVAAVTRAVAIRTQQARAVRNELVARQSSLSGARAQKQESLASVEEQRKEYLHEVDALARVSSQLAARIQGAQASNAASSPVIRTSSGFIWPVAGPVTSPFGWRWGRMHEGIDIAAPSGAPIAAAASGRVIYAGWMSGYGNLVVIDHGGGVATAYAHASAIYVGVGGAVSQGQTVAAVGCTGHCFGSHLHFEVRVNGSAVDPLGYLG